MTRLSEIEAHIGSMRELLDIVGAMRSLASMRVQEARRALPGIRRYAETMAAAIGGALLLAPDAPAASRAAASRTALVVCCAEHGFVGGFNERIFAAADALAGRDADWFVLGSRGAALAHERRRRVAWAHASATRPDGVPEIVRLLTTELYRRIAGGGLDRVDALFARHDVGGRPEIARLPLFPVDLAALAGRRPPRRQPPLHNLPPLALLERLIADYVFALLTEAAVEALASENAARFAAMEAAHGNVSQKLDELRRSARQARQDEITTELLDLVTGAAAIGHTA